MKGGFYTHIIVVIILKFGGRQGKDAAIHSCYGIETMELVL